jgi:creatinine amidohydrolase
MLIDEMTMIEFEEGLKQTQTVLIPFGSVEEHGPHLPLSTDTIQAIEVGKKTAARVPLFVAPSINYGNCRSSKTHPGTISISTETLKAIMTDIVSSFRSQGLRNFIILSGHAGGAHCMALQDAGEALIDRYDDITIAIVSEYHLASSEGVYLIETTGDSHAGEIETSRIMHTHPHLVKGSSQKEFPSFPVSGILVRNKRKYWQNGVWGDPTKATPEKGKKLEERVICKLVELVNEIGEFKE